MIFGGFRGLQDPPKYHADSYGHILDRIDFTQIIPGFYVTNIPGPGRNVGCLVTKHKKQYTGPIYSEPPWKVNAEDEVFVYTNWKI